MDAKFETPHIIDGAKSPIHCLMLEMKKSSIPMKYHYHEYIELLFSIDTDAEVYVDGVGYKFLPGDLAVINSGEAHGIKFFKNSKYICIKVMPSIICSDENAFYEYKYLMPFIRKNFGQKIFGQGDLKSEDIKGLCLEIIDEWTRKDAAYELVIRANILKIFAAIFRYWKREEFEPVNIEITPVVKSALEYVEKHFAETNAKDVAKICKVSYSHFCYVFKKALKQNFNDYITSVRLFEGKKRLISTDESITDIAFEVGFASSSHFISKFKKQEGITPKQFRAKIK